MTKEEKVELIDRIIIGLDLKTRSTIPEILDGKYPKSHSIEDKKYLILEQKILELGVVRIFGHTNKLGFGGTKGTNGYSYFELTPKGKELLLGGRSVRELFEKIEKKEDQESRGKELDLLLKDFQYKNLQKEQAIKDLTLENAKLQRINLYYALGGAGIVGLIGIILRFLE